MADYVLVDEPVAWIDIDWTSIEAGSAQEASVQVERTLRLKVRFTERSKLAEHLRAFITGTLDGQVNVNELAREVALDWSGVVDPDGRSVPFKPDLLDRLLELEPGFATGFELSYSRAMLGQGKVREKNSSGSPVAGRAGQTKTSPKPRPARSKRK